jgi:tRNA(Met) cytidine acetyltransferase
MLAHIKAQAGLKSYDCLGASFGGNQALLRFWYQAGYVPVRVGLTREHTSGEHSVLMLQGISKSGCELLDEAALRFVDGLPHLLLEQLRDLDPDMVYPLFKQVQVTFSNTIDSDDWQDLETFAFAQRTYESVVAQLWGLVLHWVSDFENDVLLNEQERRLLVVRVLQKRSWAEACKLLGLSGKREADGRIADFYKNIMFVTFWCGDANIFIGTFF